MTPRLKWQSEPNMPAMRHAPSAARLATNNASVAKGAHMFDRSLLPEPMAYFESEELPLIGRGRWRTTRCDFHNGSDSMRVNVQTGGWICMACGVKGGDVLAYHMQRNGFAFEHAARGLGAWSDEGKQRSADDKPRTLSPRSAMEVVAFELQVLSVVLSDARRGLLPNDRDWARFLRGVGAIEHLVAEYRT